MANEFRVTPEELFFLGGLMEAQYLDYDYVAAMGEIGRNFQLAQERCITDLTRAQVLRQRLSGETAVRGQEAKILQPVFFGTLETTLEMADQADANHRKIIRFHFCEGKITKVEEDNGGYRLTAMEADQVLQLAEQMLARKEPEVRKPLEPEKICKLITVKCARVGQGTTCFIFAETNAGFYTWDEAGNARQIPAAQMADRIAALLKGE